MENQTAFDLNHAIQRWRENLAQSPAFERENLNELESHLRDSAATLQTRGLSAAEAFLIATKRIGQTGMLEKEFGKVNGSAVWLDRFLWMLLGLQAWDVIFGMSSFATNVLSFFGEELKALMGFGAPDMAMGTARNFVMIIFSPVPTAIVVVLILRRLIRKKKGVTACVQKLLERPWVLGGVLFATCAVLRCFSILAFRLGYVATLIPALKSVPWRTGLLPTLWMQCSGYLILAGLIVLVAHKRRRIAAV